jgi:hypothetical protein
MTKAELVIAAALEEYGKDVRDDSSGVSRIDTYIRDGLLWTWTKRYRPQKFEWCGAFLAWCMSHAELKAKVRRKHLASCYRLWRWSGKGKPGPRRLKPCDLLPGDIAVVGPVPAPKGASRRERKRRPRWGRHITLVCRVRDDHIETVEGNARGQTKGGYSEGVIRHVRPMDADSPMAYRVLYGIRPLEAEDYDD